MLDLVLAFCEILIVLSLAGLLTCSETYRRMSKELDEQVFAALKRIMRATEESGYPPQTIPLLMLLTALCFVLSLYATPTLGR